MDDAFDACHFYRFRGCFRHCSYRHLFAERRLDALRSFAGLIPLNLSLEQRLTEVVSKVSQESWERTFARFPSWFDFYFTPPLESFERIRQLKSVKDSAVPQEPGTDLFEHFQKAVEDIFRHLVTYAYQPDQPGSIAISLEERGPRLRLMFEDVETPEPANDDVAVAVPTKRSWVSMMTDSVSS